MPASSAYVPRHLLVLLLKTSNVRIAFAVEACFHGSLLARLSAYHALQNHFLLLGRTGHSVTFFVSEDLGYLRLFFLRILNLNNVDFLF